MSRPSLTSAGKRDSSDGEDSDGEYLLRDVLVLYSRVPLSLPSDQFITHQVVARSDSGIGYVISPQVVEKHPTFHGTPKFKMLAFYQPAFFSLDSSVQLRRTSYSRRILPSQSLLQ